MKKIIKLSIFDFDGTLVNTPLPLQGKRIYREKTGKDWPHVGWWSKEESLDPNIFEFKINDAVINDYYKEMGKDNVYVILLTGRMRKLEDYVSRILSSFDLIFDEYLYGDGGGTDTDKIKKLDNLLIKFPKVKEVEMWDDRTEHFEPFKQWGQKLIDNGRLEKFKLNEIE